MDKNNVPSSETFLAEVLLHLANMRDDEVKNFRNKWGGLYSNRKRYNNQNLLKRRDELRLIWEHGIRFELANLPMNLDSPSGTPLMWEDGTEFPKMSKHAGVFLDAWIEHLAEAPPKFQTNLEEDICEHWLHLEKGKGWIVRWRPDEKGVKARRSTLPAVLIIGCLTYADRLAFCWNPKCPAPYFLAKRRDQKYCSDICTTPAKRAAKLKWWHEHRGKTSQDKKSSK